MGGSESREDVLEFSAAAGVRAARVAELLSHATGSVESTGMFNHECSRGGRNGAGRFEAFEAPTITSPTFAADADTFTARS